jgi:hypothetical protein
MAIQESTATALVRFTGLGILCFNKQQNRGEIAIIRDENHKLSIKIQQPKYKDGIEKDIVIYEDIVPVINDLQKTGIEIEIDANGASTTGGYQIYEAAGEFNRLESEDYNDIRWVVDMNSLHNETLTASKSEDRFPITKLYLGGGLFYAHKLNTTLFFAKIEKDANGKELKREDFGYVGETIGVKLDGDEVTVKIKSKGEEVIHKLPKLHGLPYRIEISNMDYGEAAMMSDMPDYYKYLTKPNDTFFELEPVNQDSEGRISSGGSVNNKAFCHPTRLDIGSIDELD